LTLEHGFSSLTLSPSLVVWHWSFELKEKQDGQSERFGDLAP
jgi:hypothetical protein